MVLKRIKNLVTGTHASQAKEYQLILSNLSLDINNPNHQINIDLIKKAFDFLIKSILI